MFAGVDGTVAPLEGVVLAGVEEDGVVPDDAGSLLDDGVVCWLSFVGCESVLAGV